MKIRSGDIVEVITGTEKGRQGKVIRAIPSKDRVIVEGIRVRFKHVRRSQQNPRGGRIKKEAPIHVSNVRMVTPKEKVATKAKGKTKR